MSDPRGPLAQLGHQLGNVVRHRDGLREPLLLGPRHGELGLERGDIGLLFRQLRRDLGPDLREHELHDRIAQHVLLQVVDQRLFDLGHGLVNGDVADSAATLVVLRAPVAEGAFMRASVRARPGCANCTSTRAALRDASQRVLRSRTSVAARTARSEHLVDREPDGVIDNPPLRYLGRDHLGRVGLHADRTAAVANLLDATVHVHATIAGVQQDRANCRWCPRTAAATTCRRRAHSLVVELMRDRLLPATREVIGEDAANDGSFLLVDDSDREAATGSIALAFERVAVASAARDSALAYARAECFARARADRFELHLVAGALDERGRLIDRVRELYFLTGRIEEELAAAIANEVADDERHFERIATEARLITADDDVAALRLCDQRAQTWSGEEIVTRTSVVDVVDVRLLAERHARDELVAALCLHVEAELLLALVVLRPAPVRANRHWSPRV